MPSLDQVRQTSSGLSLGCGSEVSDHLSRTAFPFALAVTFEENDDHLEYEAMLRQVATSCHGSSACARTRD